MDDAIESSIAEEPVYPRGDTFINADDPGLGRAIKRGIDDGAPVVLAYNDRSTRVLRGQALQE